MPPAVLPSPIPYSPESLRYRQQAGLPPLRASPAAAEADAAPGSPGSQRYRQQAEQQALAVSQMQLQRLLSESQQQLQEAAAGLADGPQQQLLQQQFLTPTSRYLPHPAGQAEQAAEGSYASTVIGSAAGGRFPQPHQQAQGMEAAAAAAAAAAVSARLAEVGQVGRR